jgi:hypothetical protein
VLHSEKGGELLLEGFAFGAERKPEIERGTDSRLDLVLVEYAAGIRNGLAGSPRRTSKVLARALAGVHKGGVFAGEPENLGFEFGGG